MKTTTITTRSGKSVAVEMDRFGRHLLNGRPFPHELKRAGQAFAWRLQNPDCRHHGGYRVWTPAGWSSWDGMMTREEALESVYCWNHDC